MLLPDAVLYIISTLNQNGYEAYAVGGCVRDSLIGRTPLDWDIATEAKPEEVKKLFQKTFDTGIQHGTITVVLDKKNYEITTYRIDGSYSDSRRPDTVTYTSQLSEDLKRRDFTMNAIAYHPSKGYADPFHGQADIKNKVIRGVGNPFQRFQEDALRMFRAVRFSAQLGFEIEPETKEAIVQAAPLIEKISRERIKDELDKLILSNAPEKILMLFETALADYLPLSILKQSMKDTIILERLKQCKGRKDLRYACLFHPLESTDCRLLLKSLTFDNKTADSIVLFIAELQKPLLAEVYPIRKRISQVGIRNFYDVLYLYSLFGQGKLAEETEKLADKIIGHGDCLFLKDLQINGKDLMDRGVEKGPKVGKILNALLDAVHQNPDLNEKKALFGWLEENKHIIF